MNGYFYPPKCRFGQLCVEDHIQVFDLRANRLLVPSAVGCSIHPMLLKGLTAFGPEVVAVSESGEFQIVNLRGLVTPSTMCVHHVEVDEAVVCALDVSPSQQCLAFGDSAGNGWCWSVCWGFISQGSLRNVCFWMVY